MKTKKKNVFIYANSDDSKEIYPSNVWHDFRIQLSEPLDLKNDKWTCSLMEVYYEKIESELYIYCDICDYNYVIGTQLPILRRIYSPQEILHPYRIGVTRQQISTLHVYIRNREGQIPDISINNIQLVLMLEGVEK